MVSSAYCRWVRLNPPLDVSIPFQRRSSVARWINKFNGSTVKSKRKGERGSPYLSPRCRSKVAVGEPFISTEAEAVITHDLIHPLHRDEKPI